MKPNREASMLNARQCVLYSGGAAGTEQFFGALAEGWGIEEVNYSFEGHQIERKRGVRLQTHEPGVHPGSPVPQSPAEHLLAGEQRQSGYRCRRNPA